jgi:peptide/nickel transport system substrate-binding protein
MSEFVANDHMTLTKYAGYWQAGDDGEPLPYLDAVSIVEVVEPTTQVLQIQAGQLGGTENIPYSQIPELQKNESGQVLLFPQQQVYFMVVQLTKPPFDDLKVRQAMSLALDRQVFVDRVTSGTAEVANSFMPKSGMCWNPNATLPYDVEKAKQLVAESGYPTGHKGAKLQVPSGSQLGRDNAVIAQQMWSQIGIELQIEEVESSTLGDNWYQSNYEAISGYQWTNGMMDAEQIVEFFFVEPRMNTDYKPSQESLDQVDAASVELDPDARCQIYYGLQDTYNTDVGGTISLYYTQSVNYVIPSVQGFVRSPLGVPLWRQTWLASS